MKLNKYIDHTLLKQQASQADVEKICDEAKQYGFASVCVNPTWVALCAELLKGSGVDVCTVVGFPLGATTTEAKVAETRDVVAKGATEVDMVINIAWAKTGRYDELEAEVRQIVEAAKTLVKVIIETCYLTDAEKEEVCRRCVAAGAQYVKTSTGFGPRGATAADVKAVLKDAYGGSIVRYTEAADADGFLSAAALAGKDAMEIAVFGNEARILLTARYDNLGKGASGAAVECMNLVLGVDPATGLNL